MALTPEERLVRRRASHRASYARWKETYKTHRNEYQRIYGYKWRKKNPDYNKLYLLRRNTKEAGRLPPKNCEICGADNKKIVWDHCHQRDVFRGWICRECNLILGMAKDDPNYLRKLIAYLERTATLVSPQLTLPGM